MTWSLQIVATLTASYDTNVATMNAALAPNRMRLSHLGADFNDSPAGFTRGTGVA
jgi:hypothetical protein